MTNKDMTHDEMDREIRKTLLGKGYDAMESDIAFNGLVSNNTTPVNGKTAIYARHSCDEEMLDKQVEELVRIAISVGDSEYVVYKEIAAPYAETYEQRDKMEEDLESQGIKRVYVRSRDRFCKDPVRSLEFARKLVDAGIEITETKTFMK